MGILNVTPDSFSDGGRFLNQEAAFRQAAQMVSAGADIIDVGGESTRPGAAPVSAEIQLERIAPVIARIRSQLDVMISVDTSEPLVMREAVAAGAHLINDVLALQKPEALESAAALNVPVVLMHSRGAPVRARAPDKDTPDIVAEVAAFLQARSEAAQAAGFDRT